MVETLQMVRQKVDMLLEPLLHRPKKRIYETEVQTTEPDRKS